MRVHLDTDLGGDPDDACALAMLLGLREVELVGITTVADRDGRRAGYLAHCLKLAGREEIPVAAGAGSSLTTRRCADPVGDDACYWPTDLTPRPSPPGAALDLLARSIAVGATVAAIGPCTNLALLEVTRPGALRWAPVVMMGGWVHLPPAGLPAWGPEMDWNVAWDTAAARIVAETTKLTRVTLPATLTAHLRAVDLPRLRAAGPLGELLARQSAAHAEDQGMTELGRAHAGLPNDLLNFHYDPVTCAVALGWPGATIETMRLRPEPVEGGLRFRLDPDGRPIRIVVDVDGEAFREVWLAAVETAARRAAPSLGS
jgi:inosine-uridine nucleoside N-ribohydrolase